MADALLHPFLYYWRQNLEQLEMTDIRSEKPEDIEAVRTLNKLAFHQETEGVIIDKIRSNCNEIFSLIAELDNKVIGHILFSPVMLKSDHSELKGMGLGPMAVLPEFQNRGIGSSLVNHGLKLVKEAGYPYVIVLGHPSYYPRFGFQPASKFQFQCQWEDVPDEAFMALIFDKKEIKDNAGTIFYRDEFNEGV